MEERRLLRDASYPVDSVWDRKPLGFLFHGGAKASARCLLPRRLCLGQETPWVSVPWRSEGFCEMPPTPSTLSGTGNPLGFCSMEEGRLLRDASYPVDSVWDRKPLGFLFHGGGKASARCLLPRRLCLGQETP